MPLLNPMGISGPTSPAPYQQPNVAAPAANSAVASFPTGAPAIGVTWPIPQYVQGGVGVSQPGWAGQAPPGPNSSPTVV